MSDAHVRDAEDRNRVFFSREYHPDALILRPATPYDASIIALRRDLIETYGAGRDVLDLCCGIGSYLRPMLDRVRTAVAVDFSPTVLARFVEALSGVVPRHLRLIQGDVTALPLTDACVDFVFSYASLYDIPRVHVVLREAARVLRPGGHAVFELGNSLSLNTAVRRACAREAPWAVPCDAPYPRLRRWVGDAGFEVVAWRVFQVLPMWYVPARLAWLFPLLTPRWKRVLGRRIGGRMLDEWVSTTRPFRYVAFRHVVVVRRPMAA